MLKYLIIQLDDASTSFCHYSNSCSRSRLIDADILEDALIWSMKEALTVQFVYPDLELPQKYKELISGIDHADIVPSTCCDRELLENADVVIFNSWNDVGSFKFKDGQSCVIRTLFSELISHAEILCSVIPFVSRLNITVTDIENFGSASEPVYATLLKEMSGEICDGYKKGHNVQVNILTDRMMLKSMNNCGAGDESITLAPDGKFYICPGFYADGSMSVGDIVTGLDIKNKQLYQLDHAPICRICDAWQCKRCVWQNKKLTLEVNTPGREQCVMSHIERNAARKLMERLRENGIIISDNIIPEIDYLDPFDKLTNKQ